MYLKNNMVTEYFCDMITISFQTHETMVKLHILFEYLIFIHLEHKIVFLIK